MTEINCKLALTKSGECQLDRDRFMADELHGKVWHTTQPERFLGILESGAILPEPNIPERDRWKAMRGRDYYPYVRWLGGVSLFDFSNFDSDTYHENYPISTWETFVPCVREWGAAIWIEIDRAKLDSRFVCGDDLLARWKADEAYRHTIMPQIEAAHLGPLEASTFARVLFACVAGYVTLDQADLDARTYAILLKEWQAGEPGEG